MTEIPGWLSTEIRKFCANKPDHLRRSEAMEGIGGQTNYICLFNIPFNYSQILHNIMFHFTQWSVKILGGN